ncbi:adenosylcobinamide-phosphate synthase CbiB [Halomicrococcus sp. SG-WS-1]|uniref:adenosylcobinamide-phosphate synthase CbiB n=1 Tax=Halomicrococcus sp. SG-WS-1 TaxID=3439057 RepID=UPI003F7A916C
MTLAGVAAVALAFALDRAVGEPPRRLHPVVWFGRATATVDRDWPSPRAASVLVALAFPAVAAVVAGLLVWRAVAVHPFVGSALAGTVLFSTTSMRMLLETADEVNGATETDLDAARDDLRALAGRDAATLSAGQVRSAVAESLSENLADGLVAPLLAFAACAPFSLPVAAGAAAWVKAVNTLDSMLGYRSKPVGWASARLDDVVMWVPARASAVLIALAGTATGGFGAVRSWASEPPSPNSGWPMATLAAALGTRFEKPEVYTLNPRARLPAVEDVERGVCVVRRASLLAYAATGVVAWF